MGISWSSNAELQNFYNKQAVEQVALQNVLFEHKRALELANKRKIIASEHLAAFLTISLLLIGQKMKQSHLFVLPTIPLVVGLFHNFDMQRDITLGSIEGKAQELLKENHHLFEPVGGPITLDELDTRINRAKFHKKKESNEAG